MTSRPERMYQEYKLDESSPALRDKENAKNFRVILGHAIDRLKEHGYDVLVSNQKCAEPAIPLSFLAGRELSKGGLPLTLNRDINGLISPLPYCPSNSFSSF